MRSTHALLPTRMKEGSHFYVCLFFFSWKTTMRTRQLPLLVLLLLLLRARHGLFQKTRNISRKIHELNQRVHVSYMENDDYSHLTVRKDSERLVVLLANCHQAPKLGGSGLLKIVENSAKNHRKGPPISHHNYIDCIHLKPLSLLSHHPP